MVIETHWLGHNIPGYKYQLLINVARYSITALYFNEDEKRAALKYSKLHSQNDGTPVLWAGKGYKVRKRI